jgi:hypothetical protein
MRKRLSILGLWLASLLCCATSNPYTGPVSDKPMVSVSYMRSFVQDDPRLPERMETIATAAITNPSNREMTVTLDCTETLTTVDIKPRTTEHVLLSAGDKECVIR